MSLALRRKLMDNAFQVICTLAALGATLILLTLLGKMIADGAPHLNFNFLTAPASHNPSKAGLGFAIIGSLWIMFLTVLFTVPVGVGAAIYLTEFNTRKSRITEFIQLNISNLAGVPSIVFGMLGLGIFIGIVGLGKSILTGALTMSILVLPVVIIVSQEALKAVPRHYREASQALGSSQWDSIRTVVLPSAMPGIMTGLILAAARAVGETAPLIVVGAASYINIAPSAGVNSRYMVVPLQILDWIQSSKSDFHSLAATAILVLIIALVLLNSAAIFIRSRARQRA